MAVQGGDHLCFAARSLPTISGMPPSTTNSSSWVTSASGQPLRSWASCGATTLGSCSGEGPLLLPHSYTYTPLYSRICLSPPHYPLLSSPLLPSLLPPSSCLFSFLYLLSFSVQGLSCFCSVSIYIPLFHLILK